METKRTYPTTDCYYGNKKQIENFCSYLIRNNKKLGADDAAQFPDVSYNNIQKVYR